MTFFVFLSIVRAFLIGFCSVFFFLSTTMAESPCALLFSSEIDTYVGQLLTENEYRERVKEETAARNAQLAENTVTNILRVPIDQMPQVLNQVITSISAGIYSLPGKVENTVIGIWEGKADQGPSRNFLDDNPLDRPVSSLPKAEVIGSILHNDIGATSQKIGRDLQSLVRHFTTLQSLTGTQGLRSKLIGLSVKIPVVGDWFSEKVTFRQVSLSTAIATVAESLTLSGEKLELWKRGLEEGTEEAKKYKSETEDYVLFLENIRDELSSILSNENSVPEQKNQIQDSLLPDLLQEIVDAETAKVALATMIDTYSAADKVLNAGQKEIQRSLKVILPILKGNLFAQSSQTGLQEMIDGQEGLRHLVSKVIPETADLIKSNAKRLAEANSTATIDPEALRRALTTLVEVKEEFNTSQKERLTKYNNLLGTLKEVEKISNKLSDDPPQLKNESRPQLPNPR